MAVEKESVTGVGEEPGCFMSISPAAVAEGGGFHG